MSDEHANESEHTPTSDRPIHKILGIGGVAVAIWKRPTDKGAEYSVLLDRSYKSESGEYVTSHYLRPSELLRAQKLIGMADDWIERDRLKGRGQDAGPGRS